MECTSLQYNEDLLWDSRRLLVRRDVRRLFKLLLVIQRILVSSSFILLLLGIKVMGYPSLRHGEHSGSTLGSLGNLLTFTFVKIYTYNLSNTSWFQSSKLMRYEKYYLVFDLSLRRW